jgi:DNA-binding transcriptional regulator LsrR (DeoR family)
MARNVVGDVGLMVKVATMYYKEQLRQEEIAEHLSMSRSSVSALLANAKANGIVDINIVNPVRVNKTLSAELEATFNLKRAVVVPSSSSDPALNRRILSERSSQVFNEFVKRNSTIGIAWGNTIYDFVSAYIHQDDLYDIHLVPLLGETDVASRTHQQNELVRALAEKTNASPTFIYAPCYPRSRRDRDLFLQTEALSALQKAWDSLDVALVGVGSPRTLGKMVPQRVLYEEHSTSRGDAIGDICVHLFDLEGNIISTNDDVLKIGISVEQLRRTPTVIAIAGGNEKAKSILGALRTGIIDVLISDERAMYEALRYNEAIDAGTITEEGKVEIRG